MGKIVEPFEVGAWIAHDEKECPKCGLMAAFAADLKAAGKKQIRVCSICRWVYINGEPYMALSPRKESDNGR